jgi:hypothetical protein
MPHINVLSDHKCYELEVIYNYLSPIQLCLATVSLFFRTYTYVSSISWNSDVFVDVDPWRFVAAVKCVKQDICVIITCVEIPATAYWLPACFTNFHWGARDSYFLQSPDWLWSSPGFLFSVYRGYFPPGLGGWSMKLTTHLYLVPRLRTSGTATPRPHMPSRHVQQQLYIEFTLIMYHSGIYYYWVLQVRCIIQK